MSLPLSVLIPAHKLSPLLAESVWNLAVCPEVWRPNQILVGLDAPLVDGSQSSLARLFPDLCEIKAFGASSPLGPATIRNKLASAASEDHLLFLDSDVIVDSGLMRAIADNLKFLDHDYLYTSRIEPIVENSISVFFNHVVLTPRSVRSRVYFPSAVWGMPRKVFERVGGFDEAFPEAGGEDWEWLTRAYATISGLSSYVLFEPAVYHDNPVTLQGLFQRAWRYGFHAPRYHEKFVPQSWPLSKRFLSKILTKFLIPLNKSIVRIERNLKREKVPNLELLWRAKVGTITMWKRLRGDTTPTREDQQTFFLFERVLFRLEGPFGAEHNGTEVGNQVAARPSRGTIRVIEAGETRLKQIRPGHTLRGVYRGRWARSLRELWDFTHNSSALIGSLVLRARRALAQRSSGG